MVIVQQLVMHDCKQNPFDGATVNEPFEHLLIPALASATVFLLLTDEQAPSLKLAEGRCLRQRPEAVSRP